MSKLPSKAHLPSAFENILNESSYKTHSQLCPLCFGWEKQTEKHDAPEGKFDSLRDIDSGSHGILVRSIGYTCSHIFRPESGPATQNLKEYSESSVST